jgi:hypothetical protein
MTKPHHEGQAMTSLTPTISRRLRRLLPAALIAATAVLGASAVGDPSIAGAAPEWDFAEYEICADKALANYQNGIITFQQYHQTVKDCCVVTSGIWSETQGCVAPPANAPGRTIPPGRPIQTLTPDLPFAPPGDITQTFTPAP